MLTIEKNEKEIRATARQLEQEAIENQKEDQEPLEAITEVLLGIRLGTSASITQDEMRRAISEQARTIAKERGIAPPATNATRERLKNHLPFILAGQPVPSYMRFQKTSSKPMEEALKDHSFIWKYMLDDLLPEDDVLQDRGAIETYAARVVDEIEKIWEYNTYPVAHRAVIEPHRIMEIYRFDERVEAEVRKQMGRPEDVLFDEAVQARIAEIKAEDLDSALGRKDQIEKALSMQKIGKGIFEMQKNRQDGLDQEREKQKRFQREELERNLKSQFG